MKKILFVIGLVFLLFFYLCSTFMELDEDEILKDSRTAFKMSMYKKEPFSEKDELLALSDFLILHGDSLLQYAFKQDPLILEKKRRLILGSSSDGSATFPIKNKEFLDHFIAPSLLDSLTLLLDSTKSTNLEKFTIWATGNQPNSLNMDFSSHRLMLQTVKSGNPNYYKYHFLYRNKWVPTSHHISSIYKSLQRDTSVIGDLRYSIRIVPYSGF